MQSKELYFPKSFLDQFGDVKFSMSGYTKYAVTYDQLRAKVHQAYWSDRQETEGLRGLVVVAALVLDNVVMTTNENNELTCLMRPIYYSDGFRGAKDEALEMAFYRLIVENIVQADTRVYQFQGIFRLDSHPSVLLIPWAIRFGHWMGLKNQRPQFQFSIRKIPEFLERMEPISSRIMYDVYSTWLTYTR